MKTMGILVLSVFLSGCATMTGWRHRQDIEFSCWRQCNDDCTTPSMVGMACLTGGIGLLIMMNSDAYKQCQAACWEKCPKINNEGR